jgi:hypothetical protein
LCGEKINAEKVNKLKVYNKIKLEELINFEKK